MGTVSAPALLGGLVDLDVLDDQVAGVEALCVGVGLGVLEEAEQDLSRLDGPTGARDAEGLACGRQCLPVVLQPQLGASPPQGISLTLCGASGAACVPPHGNGLLVLEDISKVGEGALELPAVDGLGSLAGVLEGDAEVAASRAGRLCAVDAGCSVANLHCVSASFWREWLHQWRP